MHRVVPGRNVRKVPGIANRVEQAATGFIVLSQGPAADRFTYLLLCRLLPWSCQAAMEAVAAGTVHNRDRKGSPDAKGLSHWCQSRYLCDNWHRAVASGGRENRLL